MAFDFIEFARKICADPARPPVGEEQYVLPVFYGGLSDGESATEYEAMVVLESPSRSFTMPRWKGCQSLEEAIDAHREIFFQWAFSAIPQAEVFRVLVGTPQTAAEFFRRLYITDVWKDWGFKDKLKRTNPGYIQYGRYWRSKLEMELKNVATRRVVFLGGHASRSGLGCVPDGTPAHCLVFPNWPNYTTLKKELGQLEKDITNAA